MLRAPSSINSTSTLSNSQLDGRVVIPPISARDPELLIVRSGSRATFESSEVIRISSATPRSSKGSEDTKRSEAAATPEVSIVEPFETSPYRSRACIQPAIHFAFVPRIESGADFSQDGLYRYRLVRRWDPSSPTLTFVLLNPSSADEAKDDATVKKLTALARNDGAGGFELVNLFALVDTAQDRLHLANAIGPENEIWLTDVIGRSTKLCVGWGDGNGSGDLGAARQRAVLSRVREVWPLFRHRDLWCFRVIKSGAPGHPGRIGGGTVISRYRPYRYPG